MARSHLTLAALATSAVDGLDVAAARAIGTGVHGDFEAALIAGADGKHWIIRVPTSERAEAEQSADLVSLRALSTGIRGRLPFAVSSFAGQTPVSGTRAVVYEFVHGDKITLNDIGAGEGIATSIGQAIAAIHTLPTSFIADAGLPVRSAVDTLHAAMTVMDRASATGLVPAALVGRWEGAAEDSALWQFAPTVVNGSISADSLLVAGDRVSGMLGWQTLSVGDPAQDLFWILGSRNPGTADAVIDAYQQARGSTDRQLGARARLYAELEIAKWLLHGAEERDTAIVDDAVIMLHGLVDAVQGDLGSSLTHNTMPIMAVDEVEAMLDQRGA